MQVLAVCVEGKSTDIARCVPLAPSRQQRWFRRLSLWFHLASVATAAVAAAAAAA